MAKFLKQTANKAPRKKHIFLWSLLIYTVVFVAAAAIFLNWFWGFIEGYELSRPQIAIDRYMEQLTPEQIADSSGELIAQIDHNIQSEEACKAAILDAMSGGITYARKSSECTDNKQVYVLRCGTQVIGSFTMVTGEADSYGFTPWDVTSQTFDFSFLLGDSVSVEAPEGYPVVINGVTLDSSYVTKTESVPYELFEEFYKKYELPEFKKLTYEAGPFLGQFEMQVTDPEGNPFVLDENTDINSFADNCTGEEVNELTEFANTFIEWYVIFTGCANDTAYANYLNLSRYIVPGSDLDERLKGALDGLQYAQSRGDTVAGITVHHFVNMGNDQYLVDLTYLVDTTGLAGVVQTTTNAKLVINRTKHGLKVESILTY